ncbi:winged helix DNA-binding protein [Vulcanisaeta thermophila]|uniref:winged helix DNA-binding protein n=1 Tax=Vulcanisaeta thermophila TaxID=867917 RepID=UPI000853AD5E|nr:winged helix DNA-binding protein [Vulcanisaeta thermophila]
MPRDASSIIRELSDKEAKLLTEIYRAGGEVMLKDIWKTLGMRSKAGMPFINKLEKKGLLEKENVGRGKRVMYRVRLTEVGMEIAREITEVGALIRVLTYEALTKIPCFYCPYIDVCGTTEEITPIRCEYLNKWLYEQTKGQE